jgi:hypothetical protein
MVDHFLLPDATFPPHPQEALAMIRRFQSGAMGRLDPSPGAFD